MQAAEHVGREAAARAAVPVHETHLPHLVTQVPDPGDQAHLLGDVVADPPEVDDVAPASEPGRGLDEQDLVTPFPQPVSERRTGDPRPVDDNSHARLRGRARTRRTTGRRRARRFGRPIRSMEFAARHGFRGTDNDLHDVLSVHEGRNWSDVRSVRGNSRATEERGAARAVAARGRWIRPSTQSPFLMRSASAKARSGSLACS